jgi:hypothetical protein
MKYFVKTPVNGTLSVPSFKISEQIPEALQAASSQPAQSACVQLKVF